MLDEYAPNPPPHLSSQDFRALAHQAVDWIADYLEHVEQQPVKSSVRPGDLLRALPTHAPSTPADAREWPAIFADLDRLIVPALTHWQSPNFHAYFSCNASGPAIIAEILMAGLNVNGMLWATSPAATELETRMLDWLVHALGLPASFLSTAREPTISPLGERRGGGVIQSTASEAALVALVAARARTLAHQPPSGPDLAPDRLIAYTSSQAHSSITKACMIAGFIRGPEDRSRLRLIPGDARTNYAMDPSALHAAMREDLAHGLIPCFITATLGTTSTGAFDPLVPIFNAIQALETSPSIPPPWLHVDAAWAGAAMICPEHRAFADGLAHADSFCFNPHKWLLTNFDCDCFWTRDRESVLRALAITPEYLRNQASAAGEVIDYRDWQIPLGRRFRALKLWLVLRHYGVKGMRAHIREHLRLAALLERELRDDGRFVLPTPRALSLVCFGLKPTSHPHPENQEATNARNALLLERLNATGRLLLSHTIIPDDQGQPMHVLRFAIGSTLTQERHIRQALELIKHHASELASIS
jgi:aromatic-L-amino-acid/L-tryptophan decarboxylase